MTTAARPAPTAKYAMLWCTLLATLYIFLIFILPANSATQAAYNLSSIEYHLIMLAAALPTLFVWFSAFAGYAALRQYAHAVRDTPEGSQFDQLARGSTWLVWSLPIPTIISIILSAIATKQPDFRPTGIIIANYTALILSSIAFVLIYRCGQSLLHASKQRIDHSKAKLLTGLFVIFSLLYTYLILRHMDFSTLTSTDNPYFLPVWLVIVSIVIPYLCAWFCGLVGAYQIYIYSQKTDGLLYKQAFRYLVIGITAVIVSSIALQYTNSVIPRVGYLKLDFRFSLNIFIRVIGAVGFIMVAIGSNRLKKIEEV